MRAVLKKLCVLMLCGVLATLPACSTQGVLFSAGGGACGLEARTAAWTVMIYLNGSDLESEGGEGTSSLKDILKVSLPRDVNVLVYTGGTARWHNDVVSPKANQIWIVKDQSLTMLETLPPQSMGDSTTLAGFISYALRAYPADNTALLMWNHGAGSVIGFGADELFGYDSLRLTELADALAVLDGGQPLELIGFDACMMASLETASVVAPYAKYMVASQEVEPGGGWNYTYLLERLASDTAMTGRELGSVIADSYYGRWEKTDMAGMVTCSVIDLSKVQAVEALLGDYAQHLNGRLVALPETVITLSRVRLSAEDYGEEPRTDSLDMIDLYHFIKLQRGGAQTAALLAAIEEAVVYEVSGAERPNSCGLSIFFPSALSGRSLGDYLDIYSSLGFCPEYREFVRNYAGALTRDVQSARLPGYVNDTIPMGQSDDYSEVGSYYVQLSDKQMAYMHTVYCTLGMHLDDGTVVDLGYDCNLSIDGNIIRDNFQGYWTGISGQCVTVYVMDKTADYVVYNIPVLYNDMRAVIRATWIWDSARAAGGYYVYNGMYYATDEYAAPTAKLALTPQEGDTLTPIYWPAFAADGDYDSYYAGTPIVLGPEGIVLEWILLPDGSYRYGFMFIDVYGNAHYSEMVDFMFN